MDIFSKNVNIHRVPIIDDNGEVIGIVTQTQMIKFLAEKVKEFPNIGARTLGTYLNPDICSVIAIGTTESVMDAYKIMLEKVNLQSEIPI
jgi:predicted transcriptional regulator